MASHWHSFKTISILLCIFTVWTNLVYIITFICIYWYLIYGSVADIMACGLWSKELYLYYHKRENQSHRGSTAVKVTKLQWSVKRKWYCCVQRKNKANAYILMLLFVQWTGPCCKNSSWVGLKYLNISGDNVWGIRWCYIVQQMFSHK